jgi:uncharacterized low-complexity protein
MAISKKPLAAALGAAFLATSIAPLVSAASNPFSAQQLSGGYDLASHQKDPEGKCGEGMCGDKKAAHEGKCGDNCGDHCGDKNVQGSCGAGKAAGEGSCGGMKGAHEGTCGGMTPAPAGSSDDKKAAGGAESSAQ